MSCDSAAACEGAARCSRVPRAAPAATMNGEFLVPLEPVARKSAGARRRRAARMMIAAAIGSIRSNIIAHLARERQAVSDPARMRKGTDSAEHRCSRGVIAPMPWPCSAAPFELGGRLRVRVRRAPAAIRRRCASAGERRPQHRGHETARDVVNRKRGPRRPVSFHLSLAARASQSRALHLCSAARRSTQRAINARVHARAQRDACDSTQAINLPRASACAGHLWARLHGRSTAIAILAPTTPHACMRDALTACSFSR